MLQIWRYMYSEHAIFVIFIDMFAFCVTLAFYAININIVSLFTYLSIFILMTLNFYCIDVLYQFEWINIIFF